MPNLAYGSDDSMDDDVLKPNSSSEAKDQSNGGSNDKTESRSGRGEIDDKDHSDSDGSEGAEADEYIVEAIRSHKFIKGIAHYEVKWQGWHDKDNTYEPEENLQGALAILAKYYDSIGGVPSLKRSKSKQSLRETQPPTESPAPKKRRKRNDTSVAANEEDEGTWTPSSQNWEPQVDRIDTVEKDDSGQLLAYILFKNGRKTKIGMDKVEASLPKNTTKSPELREAPPEPYAHDTSIPLKENVLFDHSREVNTGALSSLERRYDEPSALPYGNRSLGACGPQYAPDLNIPSRQGSIQTLSAQCSNISDEEHIEEAFVAPSKLQSLECHNSITILDTLWKGAAGSRRIGFGSAVRYTYKGTMS
ncbi:hypothetical protein LTR84_005979 [Exophiala bonariae]|uniref:Chromo domain-containing protein n=1 Tax=Exophiala bonariae TaxID=1690606 RepID=A0AAV9N2J1_9EURO|nr:hypothetical protein LTR84_005979 [Exophiala bonariae]